MSQPEAIIVEQLTRRFEKLTAVDGISFSIRKGEVVGFIGANGSGKTTTMRIMATLDSPTGGRVVVSGYDVVTFPEKARARVGWMPDAFGLYENMTVWEYLDFYARAFGFRGADRAARVEEVMEFTDLVDLRERRMNKLSKGMGQRLCLGRTLLHDPEVLIMDEPAAGLDPKARVEFKRLVRLLAAEGKTLFISSHILSELGEMCDSLVFIDAGKIIHQGSAEQLMRGTVQVEGHPVRVVVHGESGPLEEWAALAQDVTFIEHTRNGSRLLIAPGDEESLALALRRMVESGIQVVEFRREERKLEDAFIDLIRERGTHPTGMAPTTSESRS